VIWSEEIHCFMDTYQLRNTQSYLVWNKAIFSCQIPQSNIQFNFCRNGIHCISIRTQNTATNLQKQLMKPFRAEFHMPLIILFFTVQLSVTCPRLPKHSTW
jgi:hypothetical protein